MTWTGAPSSTRSSRPCALMSPSLLWQSMVVGLEKRQLQEIFIFGYESTLAKARSGSGSERLESSFTLWVVTARFLSNSQMWVGRWA
jgi:hypothetical protein